MAENEAANPWEPLHVEHGFPADVSTVTAIGCEGPHNIQDHYSYTGLGVLKIVAGAMGQAGSNNLLAFGHPLLSLGPEHAATIARDGYTKRQVKEFIFEHARFPLGRLGEEYRRLHRGRPRFVAGSRHPLAHRQLARRHHRDRRSAAPASTRRWQPTFGGGTKPTRRVIARRDGTPMRRAAELAR